MKILVTVALIGAALAAAGSAVIAAEEKPAATDTAPAVWAGLAAAIQEYRDAETRPARDQALERVRSFGTPEALGFLGSVATDPKVDATERERVFTMITIFQTQKSGTAVEEELARLLDDSFLGLKAANCLVGEHWGAATWKALAAHWPEDKPPAWAGQVAANMLYKMDEPAIRELFQKKMESPKFVMRSDQVAQWKYVPKEYGQRLIGFMAARPLDSRDLVRAAAVSAAGDGVHEGLDYVCDLLADVGKPYATPEAIAEKKTKHPGWMPDAWSEFNVLANWIKAHPLDAPPAEEQQKAAQVMGYKDGTKTVILKNKDRWFVLAGFTHPAADGAYYITTIDCKTQAVIGRIIAEGGMGPPPHTR